MDEDNNMMGSIIGGLAVGAGTGIINNMMAQDNARRSIAAQRSMMREQNAMNNANIMNAPMLQTEGLRMAGFNPAMVNGAGSAPAATVSQGNADMAQTIPINADDILLGAQLGNIVAQTEKTQEETRSVEQQNDIIDAANDSAVQGYLADWNREQEDLTKARDANEVGSEQWNMLDGRIKEIEKMKTKITDPSYRGALGIAKGTEAARNETRDRARRLQEYLTGHLDNAVAQKKLGNGTVDALASMPKLTKQKLAEDINHVKQSIETLKSQERLNDKTVEKLKEEITSIGDAVLRANLNDPNMIKSRYGVDSKEWKNWTDTQWRNAAFDVGKGIIQGAAAGTGLGMVNKILGPKNSFGKSGDYNWNGSGFEDGNVKQVQPFPGASIGERPNGVSQFDWNNAQTRANNATKNR